MVEDADALVFFGASGDLAAKQIFPALQLLVANGELDVPVIGVANSPWSLEEFRAHARASIEQHSTVDEAAFEVLAGLMSYVCGDYGDEDTFLRLRTELGAAERPIYYLAIPPSLFEVVAEGLSASGCTQGARIVVEKPFGRDAASAAGLDAVLHRHFTEDRIYRIDHYLGKEPVQNIMYTRFANPIFEPIWNRSHVRAIQITMAESFGVEGRGSFYDSVGTIRDVLQNHLLALVANLCMDPPAGSDSDSIRDARAMLLKAVRPLTPANVVRGQYDGYLDTPGVRRGSETETFAAIRLEIDTWRWSGVPIFIRSGKHMPETATEVMVQFRRPPADVFQEIVPPSSSHLRIRISPDVSIGLGMRMKQPGDRMVGDEVELGLSERPALVLPPYARLLGDALRGSTELFTREDLVKAQWRIIEPILGDITPIYRYRPGTWGPDEAVGMIGEFGPWHEPCLERT